MAMTGHTPPDRIRVLALCAGARLVQMAAIGPFRAGPVVQPDRAAARGKPVDDPSGQLRRLRVVIVEDEAIVAMELEMLLEDLQADVVGTATSAAAACALVLKHQPDFVTMDITLRGERDGVSAAQEIFEEYGVRSIFISSHDDAATRIRAAPCHPIAWIKKPITTADLRHAVCLVARRGT